MKPSFNDRCTLILAELKSALESVDEGQLNSLVDALLEAEKVFFIGVGRVLLALQAMVKRFNHLGIEAWCVGEINEPALTDRDLLVAGSGSGESAVPLAIAKIAKKRGAKVAHIGSNPTSSLKPFTDIFVRIPVPTKLGLEGELSSAQPMGSLFEQSLLLLGDAVALEIMSRRGITDLKALWRHHANLE